MVDRNSNKDGGWGWVIVFGLFVNLFLMLGLLRSVGLIQQKLAEYFAVSTTYASMPVVAAYVTYGLLVPLYAGVAEWLTIRAVTICGGFVGALSLAMSSLLINLPWFIVCYGVGQGISVGCLYTNCFILLRDYFDGRRSLATGIAISGASCGFLIMPLLIEFLLKTYGLGGALLVLSAIYLHCPVCAVLFRPIKDGGYNIDVIHQEHWPTKGSVKIFVENTGTLDCKPNIVIPYPLTSDDETNDKNDISSLRGTFIYNNVPLHESEKDQYLHKDGLYQHDSSCTRLLMQDEGEHCHCIKSTVLKHNDFKTTDILLNTKDGQDKMNARCGSKAHEPYRIVDSCSSCDSVNVSVSEPKNKDEVTPIYKRFLYFFILRNYVSAWFAASSFFLFTAIANTGVMLPGILEEKGLHGYTMALVLSFSGFGEFVGRLGTGVVSDFKFIKRYQLKGVTQIAASLNILVLIFHKPSALFGLQSCLFGLFSGTFNCLFSLVCFDFIPKEATSKTLVLTLQMDGLAVTLGQPCLAYLKDMTGSYDLVCAVICVCYIIGGVMVLILPVVAKIENRRVKDRKEEMTTDNKEVAHQLNNS